MTSAASCPSDGSPGLREGRVAGRTDAAFAQQTPSVPEDDENEWIQASLRGDDAAFARLAVRYRGRVSAMVGRFARGAHEREDLEQEVFIRVWRGLGRYRGDAPFEHWIMRVAIRTCYDHLRRHRQRRDLEVLVEELPIRSAADAEGDAIRRQREAWEVVQRLLEHLPEKDRLVVTLIDLEQKSVKETAALTGWSEANVKVRAFRARQRLREWHDRLFGETSR